MKVMDYELYMYINRNRQPIEIYLQRTAIAVLLS